MAERSGLSKSTIGRIRRNFGLKPTARTCPDYVLADKGYSSRANRVLLRRRGISRTIPEPRPRRSTGGAAVLVVVVRSGSTRFATSSATSSIGALASSNGDVG
jgi:hypothetical protein